jgi:isocitrate dehydrogenase (NAD+)
MAMILSGVMMLHHLGETKAAEQVEKAVAGVIVEGKNVTYDMKPNIPDARVVGTSQVAEAIIKKLRS